jgi:uncharacterized protein
MLNLLLISDGKPGHYKKAVAVAEAMARRRAARIAWLNVRMRLPILHDVLRRCFRRPRRLPGLQWLHATHRFPQEPLPDTAPDLILSSGGKTVFANAWLAQHYGCPNVFIGHTRGVHDSCFSRIVVSGGSATDDPRRIPSLIPTEIAPDMLAQAAADYLATRNAEFARQRHWTLLIGGNSGGYRFGAGDWRQLAVAIQALAERHGIRWLVTTSRRTPRRAEQFLLADNVRRYIDELVVFRTDRRRIFNSLLACGDVIFCTEDSGTMLTEAAATGKPVVSVRPCRAAATIALKQLLSLYIERRRLKRFAIDQLGELSDVDVSDGFDSAPDDELAPVYERILELFTSDRAAA